MGFGFMRSYKAARSLFSFLGFCAWVVIVVGGIVALVGASAASQVSSYGFGGKGSELASLAGLIPGLGVCLTGFILLALVQMGRASVDSAEYSQQMLKIARDQLQISRQSLNSHDSSGRTFSTQNSNLADSNSGSAYASPRTVARRDAAFSEKPSDPIDKIITYKGHQIECRGLNYTLGATQFHSLEYAKNHIDQISIDSTSALPSATVNS